MSASIKRSGGTDFAFPVTRMYRLPAFASIAVLSSAIVISAGCEFTRRSGSDIGTAPSSIPTTPTSTASSSFVGTWTSVPNSLTAHAVTGATAATAATDLSACSNFVWQVTSQTATSVAGTLSATCPGNVVLSALATGEVISATTVQIGATGTANVPGAGACPFTLEGTGILLDEDTLRVTYTGSTCAGPLSGVEVLYRDQVFPPAPEPDPPAPPPPSVPPPPPPQTVPCASNVGKDIVNCLMATFPDKLRAGVSSSQRIGNMEFLRDRAIEAGICGGLNLAWNKKRGTGPHSIDALAWRHGGIDDVVDIGAAYDDTSRPLRLIWQIVGGAPGYDPYSPRPNCG